MQIKWAKIAARPHAFDGQRRGHPASTGLGRLAATGRSIHEHPQPESPVRARVRGRARRFRPCGQRRRHCVEQPRRRRFPRAAVAREPAPCPGWRAAGMAQRRRPAGRTGAGRDLHTGRYRTRADTRTRRGRLPRRHRHQRRPGRPRDRRRSGAKLAPGHARRRPTVAAAHPRAELRRPAGAGHRPERQLRARRGAPRAAGLRGAVRRPGHRRARLGGGPPHRLFLFRLAGRRQRHRFRRPARLAGRRCGHRCHPAVRRERAPGPQVHERGARSGARQAHPDRQVGPRRRRGARRLQSYRRAGRIRPGIRRSHPPRRHAEGLHDGRAVRRGRDPGPHPASTWRTAGHPHQRRRAGRDGDRRPARRGRRAGPARTRYRGTPGRRPAPAVVARQPGRHRRRCPCRTISPRAVRAAGCARGRRGAADPCADRHRV